MRSSFLKNQPKNHQFRWLYTGFWEFFLFSVNRLATIDVYTDIWSKWPQWRTLIPILFSNCRLPEPVIPAKAGIQAFPVSTMSDSIGNL